MSLGCPHGTNPDRVRVSHTDLPRSFVWIRHRISKGKNFPQLWAYDLRESENFKYLNDKGEPIKSENPIRLFIKLSEVERGLPLQALASCYPDPDNHKPDVA